MGNAPSDVHHSSNPSAAAAAATTTTTASNAHVRPIWQNLLQKNLNGIVGGGGNALGLSKEELDKRCRPSGLYASCDWDARTIRKLIGDGKLAARLPGLEETIGRRDCRECPICFFQYTEINVTQCCQAYICTECYLQVRPQKTMKSSSMHNHNTTKSSTSCCPFCNAPKFQVRVAPPVIETDASRSSTPPPAESAVVVVTPPTITPSGFGSSLEKNERVAMMRARSSSLSESSSHNNTQLSPVQEIASLAMTPEERRALENEMRAQHRHPLTIRLEAEEAERRMRNQLEYYRNRMIQQQQQQQQQQQSSSASGSLASFPRNTSSSSTQRPTTDNRNANDLALLEAAILMSMEEQDGGSASASAARTGGTDDFHNRLLAAARRATTTTTTTTPYHFATSGRMRMTEEEQIAMAIAASLQEANINPVVATSNSTGASDENNNVNSLPS